MRNLFLTIVILLLLLGVAGFVFQDDIVRFVFAPQEQPTTSIPQPTIENQQRNDVAENEIPLVTVVAENLEIPWDIEFLPNDDLLVTERPGRLTRIDGEGNKHSIDVSAVKHSGEGGLLGLALHPNYEENNWLYVYITGHLNTEEGSGTVNRVLRYAYKDNQLSEEALILDGIPGALFHNGGQLAFGPDKYLYITTGDARNPDLAQDTDSLAGKILRMIDEKAEVYAHGSRNAQGLTWDDQERLWSTEHGRSGLLSGLDELNLIEKGKNYGWPDSQGDEVLPGTIGPVLHSGSDITWAPASLAYLDGKLYWGGLRGQSLYVYDIASKDFNTYFNTEFGRIRAVVAGPDNMLYISTSNRDGRGDVRERDDKILKINPELL